MSEYPSSDLFPLPVPTAMFVHVTSAIEEVRMSKYSSTRLFTVFKLIVLVVGLIVVTRSPTTHGQAQNCNLCQSNHQTCVANCPVGGAYEWAVCALQCAHENDNCTSSCRFPSPADCYGPCHSRFNSCNAVCDAEAGVCSASCAPGDTQCQIFCSQNRYPCYGWCQAALYDCTGPCIEGD